MKLHEYCGIIGLLALLFFRRIVMSKPHVALYIRVSTDTQFEEGYSVDAQKEMLIGYCNSKGIKNYQFYIDGGFSGSNIERPQMQMLVEDVKANKYNAVVVYKLDRLSRSQKDTLYLIEDVFNPHGVDFVSLNENMDTSTPIGRAMLGIMSAFAQLERETIRERTRMGMKERVKAGLWMGGGRIPYGYDYDRIKGILVPNKDAENIKKAFELYLQGNSLGYIANLLGMTSDKIVSGILTRRTNCGYIVYNGVEYKGQHEAIIDEDTYNRAQEMMQSRSVNNLSTSTYLLSGLLYCGKCGAKMRYQRWGKSKDPKIYCYSQQTSKKYLIKDPNCDNLKLWADEVETAVIKDLFSMSLSKSEEKASTKTTITVLETLQQNYETTTNKLKKLYNLYASSPDEILLETINESKKELDKIKVQITKERERSEISKKINKHKQDIRDIASSWEFMTDKEKQTVLRDNIERVTITDELIEIKYKF